MNYLEIGKKTVLDWLFPISCVGCQVEGDWLCQACSNKIVKAKYNSCQKMGQEFFISKNYLDELSIGFNYEEPLVKNVVHNLKYNYLVDLAGVMASLIDSNIDKKSISSENFNIAFVPLHPKKEKSRGYNQAERIAYHLAQLWNFKLVGGVKRIINNQTQTSFDRTGREKNVKDIFCCPKKLFEGQNIILVDDVITTGSTLQEAARVIKEDGGARKVIGLVFAHSAV